MQKFSNFFGEFPGCGCSRSSSWFLPDSKYILFLLVLIICTMLRSTNVLYIKFATRGGMKRLTANQGRNRTTECLQVNWSNVKKTVTDQCSYSVMPETHIGDNTQQSTTDETAMLKPLHTLVVMPKTSRLIASTSSNLRLMCSLYKLADSLLVK